MGCSLLRFSLQRITFLLFLPIFIGFIFWILELLGLQVVDRFILQSIAQLPTGPHSEYFKIFAPALVTFQDSPTIGLGPGNYRFICPTYNFDPAVFRCDNHPHNFYVQFLVETGVVGLALAVLMIGALIGKSFLVGMKDRRNAYGVAGFILPLAVFSLSAAPQTGTVNGITSLCGPGSQYHFHYLLSRLTNKTPKL